MTFSEKLKSAMKDLGINQAQVVGLTGKSKGSVSQYISGKQIPSDEVQQSIALALGLEADYFTKDAVVIAVTNHSFIKEIRTNNVGKLMRMNHKTVEDGLKQGVFPWGYAIKTSENRFRYFINAKRFAEIEGIEIPTEMLV